ncbi:MAG: ABC transporter permease [Neptuniibacter caesariensis]|uniref:ABC transporter permease n=1 Tax=Neptuniibacter caesariensis TaxID=207954 RepID=A0A2G6JPL9_NEPCE|nr:MAG: ABC transporter permease [Neptuniibacter caesariensis]
MDLQGFGHLLLSGAWITLQLAVSSLFVGLLFGIIGASAKLSSSKIANTLGNGYTLFVRGMPELLLVLTIYFGSSAVLMAIASLFGYDEYIELSPFIAGVTALSIAFGAYATEVFRSAMQEIPKGQTEAAVALGMTRLQTFRRIILPQVWRLALPGLGNLFLVLLKDTALVSVIGLNELMRQTSVAVGNTKEPFTFYFAAAMVYLLMTSVSMAGLHLLERRANRGYKGARA